ncbi:MAG TPA: class I SAM-dependent methyltransferase [Solirubrobacteraceae bacterium]|nr:class I SAM-dependent methyltransferase [Solirubrobacteraceae bacterium]
MSASASQTTATERKRHALALFAPLAPGYDSMGALLSFGQDPRWRRALVAAIRAGPGDHILDVATGTGMVAAALVRRYRCRVTALDQSAEMLSAARARRAGDPLLQERLQLVEGQAEQLPFADGQFDHLTFTYLLRYVDDPAKTLAELARVVRPGGRVAALEFGVPTHAGLRLLWRLHTRIGLPALGAIASPEWAQTGRFLARSIPDFYARLPLPEQLALWERSGIGITQLRRMSFGAGVLIVGVRSLHRAEGG